MLLALIFVGLFFILSGIVSYLNIRTLYTNGREVMRTHEMLISLTEFLGTMKDAETGQRGYLLTGDDKYLAPYNEARARAEDQLQALENLTDDTPAHRARMGPLKLRVTQKLHEIDQTITLRRTEGLSAALRLVETDRGQADMDSIRTQIAAMQAVEQQRRAQLMAEMEQALRVAVFSVVVAAILGLILTLIVAAIIRTTTVRRQAAEWVQTGLVGLNAAMQDEQRLEEIGQSILAYLSAYTGAQAGAFFVRDGGGFKQVAHLGLPVGHSLPEHFVPGQTLLGQAAREGTIRLIETPQDDSLTVATALGQWRPSHLIIGSARAENTVEAVFELGYMAQVNAVVPRLIEQAVESIALAIRAANYRAALQELLEETQRQSEELQSQSEELRVNNEELEEQSRALKEAYQRLEQQQAELEQTNSQLSDQARLLEVQRDDLARAQAETSLKAQELEQASRYKSDFLANMSHELRTPLNSSLILAKLLADNPEGNLSEEQVKFAQTIQSSGNDLLLLINDILDLSKIEAGQMEIEAEQVSLRRLTEDMTRLFAPVADEKGLSFVVESADGVPESLSTDRLRLEQILKNLLSNAFKFTKTGEVRLRLSPSARGLDFAVSDTGIGISESQKQAVFDAFRQADSTINRKYGGTGLGLSISRELTRLLGGELTLESTQGVGSTFTLSVPVAYDPAKVRQREALPPPVRVDTPSKPEILAPEASEPEADADDDRLALRPDTRSILVVEDDAPFADILRDLAHEMGFMCLISHTAEDAFEVARQYLPQAVILDVGLPDHSGLSVLDRLKRDPRTRHIPVHVVSASDYTHAALSLGAAGYMLKPVRRDELIEAFRQLETHLSERMRRILIVEDDDVQRDSVSRLLKSPDIETVGVGTAADCLEKLREGVFDCMVLDLSLPDQSGYALLETLSQEDAYAFPPVIVYTGRDISAADEQRLRRYSRSIIIKGAKSPERLLDEVTLFLHKVVTDLSPEQQKMISKARHRDAMLEGRRILVVEDDVRNVYALTNIFEPLGAIVTIARNGREALERLEAVQDEAETAIDLVLMDVMMPEMDGLTATREIRNRPQWRKLPVIMLTAKAMKDDQERCLAAGANDYLAKPLDVDKLVSLVRVWMPR